MCKRFIFNVLTKVIHIPWAKLVENPGFCEISIFTKIAYFKKKLQSHEIMN